MYRYVHSMYVLITCREDTAVSRHNIHNIIDSIFISESDVLGSITGVYLSAYV